MPPALCPRPSILRQFLSGHQFGQHVDKNVRVNGEFHVGANLEAFVQEDDAFACIFYKFSEDFQVSESLYQMLLGTKFCPCVTLSKLIPLTATLTSLTSFSFERGFIINSKTTVSSTKIKDYRAKHQFSARPFVAPSSAARAFIHLFCLPNSSFLTVCEPFYLESITDITN